MKSKEEIRDEIINGDLKSWSCSSSYTDEVEYILNQLVDENVITPFVRNFFGSDVLFSW